MGRLNGEGSRSTPRVLTLEEARKRTLAAGGGNVEDEEEEEEGQFQSFLHQYHFHTLHQQQQQQPTAPKKQKTARATAGRLIAVPGGHIVRSTGGNDRHSKVCTSKGLRDRRVRLSAHTAIEFYDVQDRLGYDRPSMAVDWLLKSAKAAIDGLDELPPWQPTADGTAATAGGVQEVVLTADEPVTYSDTGTQVESFPMVASSSYPPDLLSRTSSHVQDLRLSLDSGPNLFSFDDATAETTARGSSGIGGGGGYLFNLPARQQQQPMMIGPRFFTQSWGPLQSSSSPPVPSWMDQIAPSTSSMHPPAALFHRSWSSVPNIEFGASGGGGGGGFSSFLMPSAWIQGREHVDDDGVSDKPPASH